MEGAKERGIGSAALGLALSCRELQFVLPNRRASMSAPRFRRFGGRSRGAIGDLPVLPVMA
jgi:hypothetical protein